MKKINFIAALVIISIAFFAYLISVALQLNSWSDILSLICAFAGTFILFIAFIKSNRTHFVYYSLLFYSFACLSWAFADVLWAVYDLIVDSDPSKIALITFFYMLTNIFFAAGTLLFALHQFKSWNIAKLILDITVFSFASILLAWIIFFSRSDMILSMLAFDGLFSVISILTDILIYVGIVVWYLSIRDGKIPLYVRFIAGGIFLFVLTDLYYYYIAYNGLYTANSFIDAIYIAALLIVAIGGLLDMYSHKADLITSMELTYNVGGFSKELLILLCPILVIFLRGFVLSEFLIFISLPLIYIGLNTYFESAIKNEELLKRELKINNELERLLAEHTKKLSETNAELSRKNQELSYLSNTDTLTHLYNRRYFLESLEKSIANSPPHQTITVFYMDLDRFKLINDTYGHSMGDRVLIEISNRLAKSASRDTTIARMGGDEFVLAYTGSDNNTSAMSMAKKIIATCSEKILINGYVFYPALCIGISIFPDDAQTAETLIKNADISLYHAKAQGINKYAMFSSLIHEKNKKRNEIELFLRKDDFYKDLRLYYQPQFSIPDQKLIGAEALIRWISAENKIMTPEEFVRIAEETDHINEIGIWVMKTAVEQIIKWNTLYNQNLKMGINISPKQLDSTSLLTELNQIEAEGSFNPQWLDIEITESIAMDGEYRMSQIFNLFKSIGLSVSIDDFGTGYSSISYLKHYTFDRIKIAKPLIDSIVTSTKGKQIVQAIILLTETIGIHTIAEGVETKEQLEILAELGCEQVQGFYLGRPMPAENFEAAFLNLQNSNP